MNKQLTIDLFRHLTFTVGRDALKHEWGHVQKEDALTHIESWLTANRDWWEAQNLLIKDIDWACLLGLVLGDLAGMDLSEADLSDLDFSGYSFKDANLIHARCQRTKFIKADLRNASMIGCNLFFA